MIKIFEIASDVSTPLGLSGIFATILFFILRQLIAKNRANSQNDKNVTVKILNMLFVLSLITIVLGFSGWVLSQIYLDVRSHTVKFNVFVDDKVAEAIKVNAVNVDGSTLSSEKGLVRLTFEKTDSLMIQLISKEFNIDTVLPQYSINVFPKRIYLRSHKKITVDNNKLIHPKLQTVIKESKITDANIVEAVKSTPRPILVAKPENKSTKIVIADPPVYISKKYEPVVRYSLIYKKPNGLYESWFSAIFINKTGVNLRLYFANCDTSSPAESRQHSVSIPNGDEGEMPKMLLGWGKTDLDAKSISDPYTFYFICDETKEFGTISATVIGGHEHKIEITRANISLRINGKRMYGQY